ncbi:SDR family NAD(P)-dependent oxidoreductase [Methylocella silvestris]|uniref:Glucose 1-dehydrogenase n=1 Tax=Methylocella silvestris TaxID=199596 RepID=A0A2J7THF0_METSI|nr:SDR family NAD(P)-dependent oxidoreductase [Methylocella silvestris]PNG26193.1 glucose 1-dehydrogenase [Methylocella silvestris]
MSETSARRISVVFGVGAASGLGAALARRFAREGLVVYLAGRTQERLEARAAEIRAAGGEAHARGLDATKEGEVIALLDEAVQGGALDLVVFNAGANVAAPLLDVSAHEFEQLWRQNAFGGFLVGREAARRMAPNGRGVILFTGATASLRARPPFTAFAAAKAALRAVAQGLAREFGPRGLHVAHIVIDGVIDGDYARARFPQFVAAKGEDGLLKADEIADAYWSLYRQPRSAFTHELDLRPFSEPF